MKKLTKIAATVGVLLVVTAAAYAGTCRTTCYTDAAGYQHCTTRCSNY